MKSYPSQTGVPAFTCEEFAPRQHDYCLLIPIINEGDRILTELDRARKAEISSCCDIVLCDGGSTDGSMEPARLQNLEVNTLLIKTDSGKQGAQLRMGLWWALQRGYQGILTIDGNNKDSIESVPLLMQKLEEGYDFVQGSRFIKGGHAVNTPASRLLAVRLLHAPVISLTCGQWFTDTTNAFRGYSAAYLNHPKVKPFRDIFPGYELLAYLSTRWAQAGLKACEVPVDRVYPKGEPAPTKIKGIKGNADLLKILFTNLFGGYCPKKKH